jgi:hypothetical protein
MESVMKLEEKSAKNTIYIIRVWENAQRTLKKEDKMSFAIINVKRPDTRSRRKDKI